MQIQHNNDQLNDLTFKIQVIFKNLLKLNILGCR